MQAELLAKMKDTEKVNKEIKQKQIVDKLQSQLAFFIDKLEKHELLEVDESLKKNCGIDIDMIVQKHHKDAPLTERVNRVQHSPQKEDAGPNS